MEIFWFGQACFKIKGRNAIVTLDPYDPDYVGLKAPKDLLADVVLVSHQHKDHNFSTSQMTFTKPGEYEVKGVVITGIPSFHDNSEGQERGINTIFHLLYDGLNIVHLGDLGQSTLTQEQVAQIGEPDILLVPVGGIYTINAEAASDIVSQLEPKIIIPMHYKLEGLKFELDPVDKFLKEMGAEGVVPVPKLSITKDKLPEEPQVVVLAKS